MPHLFFLVLGASLFACLAFVLLCFAAYIPSPFLAFGAAVLALLAGALISIIDEMHN